MSNVAFFAQPPGEAQRALARVADLVAAMAASSPVAVGIGKEAFHHDQTEEQLVERGNHDH